MFVVELAGLQAVMELAEELVEQVPLGLAVPVSGGAAGIEVAAGARGAAQRRQRPYRADGGQAPVFDMPVCHDGFLAAGAGDRRRSGEGLQPARVGETGAVVSDLGQHPGTGQASQPRKAGDDRGVRVLSKWAIAASANSSTAAQAASNWRSSAPSWMPIAFSTTGG